MTPAARDGRGASHHAGSGPGAGIERHGTVGSTNDVARERLLAGAPELLVVVADEQTAGRGRDGRGWVGPSGRALLLSVAFRPSWLFPGDAWRLAATVSLAMADAAEEVAGLRDGTIRLKWPNDLVVEASDGTIRKLGGVLGETAGLGSADPIAVVGIGVNADWPAAEFPPELAGSMTSLREAAGGRPVDREVLLDAFVPRLEARIAALRDGRFDGGGWVTRQLTNGRLVRLDHPDGGSEVVRATGVDVRTGALLVADADPALISAAGRPGVRLPSSSSSRDERERPVTVGEIAHLRVADDPSRPSPDGEV